MPPVELCLSTLDEQIISLMPIPAHNIVTKRLLEDCLSKRSERVFGAAVFEARRLEQSHISIENIMLGLIIVSGGITEEVLTYFEIYDQPAREYLESACIRGSDRTAARRDLSYNGWLLLEKSLAIAQKWQDKEIEPEHMLLAIVDERFGIAALACEALELDCEEIRSVLTARMIAERKNRGTKLL